MPLISKTFTFSPNTTAKAAEVNAVLDQLFNAVNGLLDDANIATLAEGKIVFAGATGHDHSGGVQGSLVAMPLAQCRLTFVDTTHLRLDPFGGNHIFLPGPGETLVIPAAGVVLLPTALTPGSLYYIYVLQTAGVLSLEASTTVWTVDTTSGMPIKTGDPTRVLTGMALVQAGPNFVSTAARRFVLSYFNRRSLTSVNVGTADIDISSVPWAEVSATERAEFLTWADEHVLVGATGFFGGPGSFGQAWAGLAIDFAATRLPGGGESNVNGGIVPFGLTGPSILAEGYHLASIAARVQTGFVRFYGSATNGETRSVWALVRG